MDKSSSTLTTGNESEFDLVSYTVSEPVLSVGDIKLDDASIQSDAWCSNYPVVSHDNLLPASMSFNSGVCGV